MTGFILALVALSVAATAWVRSTLRPPKPGRTLLQHATTALLATGFALGLTTFAFGEVTGTGTCFSLTRGGPTLFCASPDHPWIRGLWLSLLAAATALSWGVLFNLVVPKRARPGDDDP